MTFDLRGGMAGWNWRRWTAAREAAVLDESDLWEATCSIQRELDRSTLPEADLRALRKAAVTVHGYAEGAQDRTGETCFSALIHTNGRWIGLELHPDDTLDPDDPANADHVAHDTVVHPGPTLADVFVTETGLRRLEAFTTPGPPPGVTGFLSRTVRAQLVDLPAPHPGARTATAESATNRR